MASEHHLFEIAATRLGGSSPGPGHHFCDDVDDSSWSPCIQGQHLRCVYSTNSAAGTVSFNLCLPYSGTREPVSASFKLSLLDREGRPVLSRTRATSFQNCLMQKMWKWECPGFITRDDLERQEYLNRDGRFTIRCDIAIKSFTAKANVFVTVPPSDLHRHLLDLFAFHVPGRHRPVRLKDATDVTFQFAGGETFAVHRCVLASRSPVFRAQLFGEMEESKSTGVVIPIEDMEPQAFSSMLTFIYSDSLRDTAVSRSEQRGDDDEAMVQYQHLLAAADRYALERLKLICQEKLCRYIRADSVAAILVLADRHRCPGLKEACFHFLTSSANLVSFITETDGFEVLIASCPALVKELLAKLATVLIF